MHLVFQLTLDSKLKLSFRWCGANGFAHRKCTMDTALPRWFDPKLFPPLAIYYGGQDYLVDTESLLQRLKDKEKVKLIRVQKLECEVSLPLPWTKRKGH